jgi:hypothetical protein
MPPISVYVSNGNVLSVGTAFTAVAFFNSLRWTLIQLPSSLTNVIIGLVSLKRIQARMWFGVAAISYSHHR